MGEFSSAFDTAQKRKLDEQARLQAEQDAQADAAKRAKADNERWIVQQLIPLLEEASADLTGKLPMSWWPTKNGEGIALVFAPSQPKSVGPADFAVNLNEKGAVSVFAGNKAAEAAGTIDNPDTISKVKRLLIAEVSARG